jgi:hypothetical protein
LVAMLSLYNIWQDSRVRDGQQCCENVSEWHHDESLNNSARPRAP